MTTGVERDRVRAELPTTGRDGGDYGAGAKQVERGEIALEAREHGPARRILDVETRDGWTYRFQRYAACEPWVRYNRERPGGSVITRRAGQLPRSVERYRDAVDDGHVTPTLDPANPPREVDAEITEQVDVVAIDGGTQRTQSHEN
jgi:hypothetical protein